MYLKISRTRSDPVLLPQTLPKNSAHEIRNWSRCSEPVKALQLLPRCATAGRASQGPKVRVERYPRDLEQGFSPSSPSLVIPKAREGTLLLPIETTRAIDRNNGRRSDRCGVSNL